MVPMEYEVRSGRPLQIIVQDEAGKKWAITCSLSIMNVVDKGTKNPDGSPQFDVGFALAFNTSPAEQK